MPKCLSINKLRVTTGIAYILGLIAVIQLLTCNGRYNYEHLPRKNIKDNLYAKVNPNLPLKKSNSDCKYVTDAKESTSISISDIPKKFNEFSVQGIVNGSYTPENCNPLFSVALLVTYRNRQSQLEVFMPYIHNFLRKQNLHYKIYLIEQQGDNQWNKGILYNIGAQYAIADKFPCLILHDIDLLPLNEGNLYACLDQPRHMSASIDKFRFVLPYDTLVGGVLAIRSEQYKDINGFSNRYWNWGGEDDDLAARITAHNMKILRFPPDLSRYTMLIHHQELQNKDRFRILSQKKNDIEKDGFNSVKYSSVSVKPNVLFTLIRVKL